MQVSPEDLMQLGAHRHCINATPKRVEQSI
jgi:hypothetical protein